MFRDLRLSWLGGAGVFGPIDVHSTSTGVFRAAAASVISRPAANTALPARFGPPTAGVSTNACHAYATAAPPLRASLWRGPQPSARDQIRIMRITLTSRTR